MTGTLIETSLHAVIRLDAGTVFDDQLPPARHRRIHLEMLHRHTSGLVELAAGRRPPGGSVAITTRDHEDHFLPGGAAGHEDWLDELLELAAFHDKRDEEVFVGVGERDAPRGHKWHVRATRCLWVDVDKPDRLAALRAFFREPTKRLPEGRQPHLVIESAGSGGMHSYWMLEEPLAAVTVRTAASETIVNPAIVRPPDSDCVIYADPSTGEVFDGELEVVEPIEAANQRLIHAIGYRIDERGRQVPTVADAVCRERARVLRLAGTRNFKTGRHARIVFADLHRPPYRLDELVGELPDPRDWPIARKLRNGGPSFDDDDPYKRIPIAEVYEALTGHEAPGRGKVRCPHRDHVNNYPSCSLGADSFFCHACGAAGGNYQLASAVLGGPTEHLRGAEFKSAKALLVERFGER